MEDEDLIQREDMVVLVSHGGYIKRAPLTTYRAQRRGGKGRGAMATRDEDFVARLFVASTHQPVLFFSSTGQVYKLKVWRLPLAAPQARGKALVNLLPLEQDERITTIMPLPEDEESWEALDVMFATTRGTVRRNKLSDFAQVNRAGKIAMRIDEGERIVDVQICSNKDDVLLTTARGQCIRFPVDDVRVFKGRNSMGVRGVALAEGDSIISLSILRSIRCDRRRARRLSQATSGDRGRGGEVEAAAESEDENGAEPNGASTLEPERFEAMRASEQVILTISENGYGKRTSSFEYRVTGRGGKGIVAMAVNARNGALVASFPVEETDEIMLVTDGGQLIRVPVDRHPHRRPVDAGRDRVRHGGRGTRRLGRPHWRDGRRDRKRRGSGVACSGAHRKTYRKVYVGHRIGGKYTRVLEKTHGRDSRTSASADPSPLRRRRILQDGRDRRSGRPRSRRANRRRDH